MKLTLTAAALATVLAAPAFAQAPATAPNATAPAATTAAPAAGTTATQAGAVGFLQNQSAQEWRTTQLVGTNVHGPDNASIGEINDVIIGSDGNIRAAVIGVGGFLGIGQKDVAVPFSSLNVTRRDNAAGIDRINVTFTKEQLEQAPSFAYYTGSGSAATTGSGATPAGSGTAPATPAR